MHTHKGALPGPFFYAGVRDAAHADLFLMATTHPASLDAPRAVKAGTIDTATGLGLRASHQEAGAAAGEAIEE